VRKIKTRSKNIDVCQRFQVIMRMFELGESHIRLCDLSDLPGQDDDVLKVSLSAGNGGRTRARRGNAVSQQRIAGPGTGIRFGAVSGAP
jgi:hypothetical protein